MSDHQMFVLAIAGAVVFIIAVFLPPDLPEKYYQLSCALSALVARLRGKRVQSFRL